MTARLPHNPRVLAGPADPAPADAIEQLGGRRPVLGQWVLKLERIAEAQAAALIRATEACGGEVRTGGADAIVHFMAERAGPLLRALATEADTLAHALRVTLEAWERTTFSLRCGGGALSLGGRTLVMGIVNVTPDSFSDGGEFLDHAAAVAQGLRCVMQGADLLDIGGESTRPGAAAVDADEECRRVVPVIERLAAETAVPLSIDTAKAAVARAALDAGATLLNDVTALRADPQMAAVAADSGAPLCLMHMQGTPRTMQQAPHYDDLMGEIVGALRESLALAVDAGVDEQQILVDPGIGFGKTLAHNLAILRRLPELRSLGRPILLGTSRKSFIGKTLGLPVEERAFGTAATVAYGIAQGARIVRVHDVAEMSQVARMTDAMMGKTAD